MARKTGSEPQFKFLQLIDPKNIPAPEHRGKPSVVQTLSFWPELRETFDTAAEKGMVPFEAVEINLDNYTSELKVLKKPLLTVLSGIRKLRKQMGLEKKVDVQYRGNRIFLIGS